jgi:hypothetical protein
LWESRITSTLVIAEKHAVITEKVSVITEKVSVITEKVSVITEKVSAITEKEIDVKIRSRKEPQRYIGSNDLTVN